MSRENIDLVQNLIPPPETDVAALLRDDALFGQMIAAGDCVVVETLAAAGVQER